IRLSSLLFLVSMKKWQKLKQMVERSYRTKCLSKGWGRTHISKIRKAISWGCGRIRATRHDIVGAYSNKTNIGYEHAHSYHRRYLCYQGKEPCKTFWKNQSTRRAGPGR